VDIVSDSSRDLTIVLILLDLAMDMFFFSLGAEAVTFNSIVDIKRPLVQITDKPISNPDRKVIDTVKKDTHDHILLQGHLTNGVLFTYHLRGGKPFAPGESLTWYIYGETGEISIKGPSSLFNFGNKAFIVRLSHNDGSTPEEITIEGDDLSALPASADNVARLYEAFADNHTDKYPDWDAAVRRHRLIEELYQRDSNNNQEQEAKYVSV
jgi:predicted dehydrogenase